MSSIPKLLTDKTLTFFIGSKPYQVDRGVATFDDIVAELNSPDPDTKRLIELADASRKLVKTLAAAIETNEKATGGDTYLAKGVIAVDRNGVTYNGEPLHNALADRLMDLLNNGFPLAPWVKFAENLYMNPAEHAREELYLWLESADLPITEDGHFLAYKRVRADYTDIHSGKFDNSVGQLVQMPGGRPAVDPVRDHLCSTGLHFCSKEYLPSFANSYDSHVMLVKINPAEVVSIPSDYNNTKGRTWRYEVIGEVPVEEVATKTWAPVYTTDANDDDDQQDEPDEGEDVNDTADEVDEDEVWDLAYDGAKTRFMAWDIVSLRRSASKAGLNSTIAWKVYSKSQLADFLAAREADKAVESL